MPRNGSATRPPIAVIGGAGHVGLPLALTFANEGHPTLIYDIDGPKIERILAGHMSFREEGGQEALSQALASGLLRASSSPEGLRDCEFLVLVVGTPVDEHLNPTFNAIHRALEGCLPYLKSPTVATGCGRQPPEGSRPASHDEGGSGSVPVLLPGLGSRREALGIKGLVVFIGIVPDEIFLGPAPEHGIILTGLLAFLPRGDQLATGTSHAHGPTGIRPTSRNVFFGRCSGRTRTRVFGADRFATMAATAHGRVPAWVREQEACRLAAKFRELFDRKRHRTSMAKTTRAA
ncbi:MAG: hypothetical protein GX934_06715 [Burkholderiales bacterium]|nr:hypothetical protein [Burkholderiales bacterium]